MIKKEAGLLKNITHQLGLQFPYSAMRTKTWHVERRKGEDIIKGSAIGFSYTEKDRLLVPGMLKSFYFAEFVVSCYDSKNRKSFNFNESKRHKAIIRQARRAGAKYFWGVGPKRRISEEAIKIVRAHMHLVEDGNIMMTNYRFFWGRALRRIRTDGALWNKRKTSAFFPLLTDNQYGHKPLHHRWRPKNLPKVYLDINQYYIGRHTKAVLKSKFKFYKSQKFKTDFWKSAVIEDFISNNITTERIDEHIKGLGWRERCFKG
jgi:hypothetical protein